VSACTGNVVPGTPAGAGEVFAGASQASNAAAYGTSGAGSGRRDDDAAQSREWLKVPLLEMIL
jgi:hypothetical protein